MISLLHSKNDNKNNIRIQLNVIIKLNHTKIYLRPTFQNILRKRINFTIDFLRDKSVLRAWPFLYVRVVIRI